MSSLVEGFRVHCGLSVFQRFVFGIKNAAEQTTQTQQSGNEKSTTSLYDPLSLCVNKFSNVVIVCAVCAVCTESSTNAV